MAYRSVTNFTRPKRNLGHIVKRLYAMYGFLNFISVILYAKTHTSKTQIVEFLQMSTGGIVGVPFKTKIKISRSIGGFKEAID